MKTQDRRNETIMKKHNIPSSKNTKNLRSLDGLDSDLLKAIVGGAKSSAAAAQPVAAPATCGDYIITMGG